MSGLPDGYTVEQNLLTWPRVDTDNRVVYIPAIRTEGDYAVCLHELGHVYTLDEKWLDQYARYRWQSEVAAWRWARKVSTRWTLTMQGMATECLTMYRRQCQPRSYDRKLTHRW